MSSRGGRMFLWFVWKWIGFLFCFIFNRCVFHERFSAACACVASVHIAWLRAYMCGLGGCVPRKRAIEKKCLLRIRKCVASSSITSCSWISTAAALPPVFRWLPSDQNLFLLFLLESLWFLFFVLHHQYLIATSCLFSFVLIPGKATVYSFVFRHLEHPAYIYIYSNPSPNKTQIYKKLHYCVGPCRRCWAYTSHWNHYSICFFFFGVLYYIQSIFFSSRWRLLDSSFPFSSHYALHSNRLYLICISYNNRTQERKRKSP